MLLPEWSTPELCYLQAKFAALASYRVAATLLAELLPLGRPLHATAVRRHAQAVADRLDDELGPERPSVICQRVRAALPRPDLPLLVSLDGGLRPLQPATVPPGRVVRGDRRQGHPGGQVLRVRPDLRPKPKRRLFDLLIPQGMQAN